MLLVQCVRLLRLQGNIWDFEHHEQNGSPFRWLAVFPLFGVFVGFPDSLHPRSGFGGLRDITSRGCL